MFFEFVRDVFAGVRKKAEGPDTVLKMGNETGIEVKEADEGVKGLAGGG